VREATQERLSNHILAWSLSKQMQMRSPVLQLIIKSFSPMLERSEVMYVKKKQWAEDLFFHLYHKVESISYIWYIRNKRHVRMRICWTAKKTNQRDFSVVI